MSADPQFKLGEHDARLDGLEDRLGSMEKKLDQALGILNQAQGGWKILVAVGGLASAIGAAGGWFIHFLFGK